MPLTVDEVVHALEAERGIDVVALPLANRSDLAEHMVFVTGRSVPHMRKCADMLVAAVCVRVLRVCRWLFMHGNTVARTRCAA